MIGTMRKMSDDTMRGFGFEDKGVGDLNQWTNEELAITFWGNPTYKHFLAALTDKFHVDGVVQTRNAIKVALGILH